MFRKILLAVAISARAAFAQDDIDLSLEDLLGLKSMLAAKRELTTRESPGIISVVTREEIEKSGARDLMEILSLHVPGISFGVDVEGVVGIGVRGLWGHEGKVLLMIDGIPLNEEVFSTTQFGNHYPAEMIERVEVIRGPGSVIHGGYAMVGVVNMVTRGAAQNGAGVTYRYSALSNSPSHANGTAMIGGQSGELRYDLTASAGTGRRSEDEMIDGGMQAHDLSDKSLLAPALVTGGVKWRGLTARALYDRYATSHLHFGDEAAPGTPAYSETFASQALSLSYEFKASSDLTITPRYMYRATYPWRLDAPDDAYEFTKYSQRSHYGVDANARLSENVSLLAGLEWSNLRIRIDSDDSSSREPDFLISPGGLNEEIWALYSELSWNTSFGNVSFGARYEKPKNFDEALVPRLALTRAWERLHYKIMASQSYRAPAGIQADRRNNPARPLKPEVATNLELEVGYKFSPSLLASVNVFDTKIQDPVVYTTGGGGTGGYDNEGRLGTSGAETELRYKSGRLESLVNLAYYQRTHADEALYAVPTHRTSYLAFANWRGNAVLGYNFTRDFGIFPSVQYFGERWGYMGSGTPGSTAFTLERAKPQWITNVNLRYSNLFVEGLSASLGLMNIGDEDHVLYQAYDGGYPALPSSGRAINAMISYRLAY